MTDSRKTTLRRLLAILCACGFTLLLILVISEQTAGFDGPVQAFFLELRSDVLTPAVIVMTNTAHRYVISALCLILLIVPRTRLPFGVPLSAASLVMTIVNHLIKPLVGRSRPDEILHLVEESNFSFPSGHAVGSMVFYGLAIWLVWHYVSNKKTAAVLTVLLGIPLVFVGMTRVYLGVHFPTDVLAGWCLGAVAIVITAEIILAVERRRGALLTEPPAQKSASSDQNSTAPGSRSK